MHNSPHCAQCKKPLVDPPFHRVLRDDALQKQYYSRKNETISVIHWGQRKLLLSEIEFLTAIGPKNLKDSLIVYAGASPGTHISYLSELFPRAHFLLVDPAPFTVKESKEIKIIQDLFTDEMAQELAKKHKNIYFISDIRTADPYADEPDDNEQKIKSDMQAQQSWHLMLRSKRSMLKFRLPWDKETSTYLDGDIYLPVFGPQSTSESRLITKDDDPNAMRAYNHEKYESQMFYFNCVTRPAMYSHSVSACGLDNCYDCRAEIEIIKNYLVQTNHVLPHSSEIAKISETMSWKICRNRTLEDPNPDKEHRLAVIKRRQNDHGQPFYIKKRKCINNK